MVKNEVIDESTLLVSPYRRTLQLSVVKATEGNSYIMDDEGIMMPKNYLFEKQRKTSLYHCKYNTELMMCLSYKALQLCNWIGLHLEPNKDYIMLNRVHFMKQSQTKSAITYNAAIAELVRLQVIIQTHYKTVYWVDPSLWFNGNRINKYQNNVIVKSEI